MTVSIVDGDRGTGRTYVAMLEYSSKTTHKGLERREGIRRFLYQIGDHLGRGVHSGPQTRLGLVLARGGAPFEDTIPRLRAFALSSYRLGGI